MIENRRFKTSIPLMDTNLLRLTINTVLSINPKKTNGLGNKLYSMTYDIECLQSGESHKGEVIKLEHCGDFGPESYGKFGEDIEQEILHNNSLARHEIICIESLMSMKIHHNSDTMIGDAYQLNNDTKREMKELIDAFLVESKVEDAKISSIESDCFRNFVVDKGALIDNQDILWICVKMEAVFRDSAFRDLMEHSCNRFVSYGDKFTGKIKASDYEDFVNILLDITGRYVSSMKEIANAYATELIRYARNMIYDKVKIIKSLDPNKSKFKKGRERA